MSKLDELIKELCPNGVEYKTLGELGKFYGGLTGKSKDDFTNGNAKFITYKNVYANPALEIDVPDRVKIEEGENQHTLEYGDVIFTGSSETPDECGISSVLTIHTDEKLYLNSFCFIFRFNDVSIMDPDFAKHLFRSRRLRYQIGKTANGVTRYNVSKKLMEKVVIPVPPLEVQREIVRVLDSFTLLTAELTAELTARRKQYEFYRDQLLSFADAQGGAQTDVTWLPLSEVFTMRNGYTPSKANKSFWEGGSIPWFRMEDIRENGRILSDSIQHITPEAVKGKLFPANSIILATTATIGEHALIIADSLANQQFTFFSKCKSLENKLDMKFAFYYFFKIDEWCKQNTNVSSFPSVDMPKLKKYMFPIPPIEKQREIAAILDRFDVLCNDISDGLPAEIEARQKQYEYYRDKLLSFN